MYHYDLQQWLLFFYIYCFFGWCWESPYVSIKQKHWVNRGFMKGPFLPIYGSGAIAILIATLPVRSMPVLVYIFGLIGATALELVTGICMEKMFHVRYWDYSYQKFNYKGHICLTSSIAWGAFSLAMIYGFHKPVERFVLAIPNNFLDIISTILTVIIVADFAISFKTAMELRDILDSMERMKDEMKRLQKRAEVLEAFLADDINNAKEEWTEKAVEFKDGITEKTAEFKDGIVEITTEFRAGIAEKTTELRDEITEKTAEFRDGFEEKTNEIKEGFSLKKEDAIKQLEEIKEKQRQYGLKAKQYVAQSKSIANMLRRNPTAVSGKHRNSFSEYRDRLFEAMKNEQKHGNNSR